MTVIVCVDDGMGMMFNRRRQSRDSLLRKRLLELAEGSRLWMDAYSAGQFEEGTEGITVDEDFLSKAGEDDLCFVESRPLRPHVERIGRLILCRWNRAYPSDVKLDLELSGWRLTGVYEYPGSSHERISEETYVKKDRQEEKGDA